MGLVLVGLVAVGLILVVLVRVRLVQVVGPSGIDVRGVDPTWVDASGVNPNASALVAFGVDRDEDKWESETSASLVSSSDDETRPRYPQYHPPKSFSKVHFELKM